MKAISFTRYGSPDVLQFTETEQPAPKEYQVLVKVHAASANPLDWHSMRGAPVLVRLSGGLRKPKDQRLGVDFAGRVEAVGSAVTQFQPGDDVFGRGVGTFAEYAVARATACVRKPANISFEAAAAVPVAALTALLGLRDKGAIQPGQQVLVNGASGGVGSFAVQIAKSYGAEVTGVCSTANLDLVRSIGADHVIDYTREDFSKKKQRYDLIYDAVGNRRIAAYGRALKPHGICVMAGFGSMSLLLGHMINGPLSTRFGNKTFITLMVENPPQEDLAFIGDLLESGKVVPVIDRHYPLSETAEAIRYLEGMHARGKVIITMA